MSLSGDVNAFLIAGEQSGDRLGGNLMAMLKERSSRKIHFQGVGGAMMKSAGLQSLFDMEDIAVMGFSAVIARLPKILNRINQTAAAAIAANPDILIIIDSPDFTHRVARKVKAKLPHLLVVNYVCPSVWAWRPTRARKMMAYVDHVLTILPFEPKILRELGGPGATYVGHPLFVDGLKKKPLLDEDKQKSLLVLPGSRSSEVSRLLPVFAETIDYLAARRDDFNVIIPAVPGQEAYIRDHVRGWKMNPAIVVGNDEKALAFKNADAALAASGTVCLELALADVPMVAAYKLDLIAKRLRFLVTTWSANLANLIVDYPAVPEYIDEFARPNSIAKALDRLLSNTPERNAQLAAFSKVRDQMRDDELKEPGQKAAETILSLLDNHTV